MATSVYWTPAGGDLAPVEVTLLDGKGKLILTGQLGDVMRESAQAALSFARSRRRWLQLDKDFAEHRDIHMHLPAGGIPKDGPSAGITMATALISALTGREVRADVAMTGEITLRGRVLPIGGLKEKVLAAHRGGIGTIVLPARNRKDLFRRTGGRAGSVGDCLCRAYGGSARRGRSQHSQRRPLSLTARRWHPEQAA